MKTGRNDLCPCGSGKKYKKCCLQKQTVAEKDLEVQNSRKNRESDSFDNDAETWFNLMNNLRKITLDRKQHIKEYYKIRKMHSEIVSAMAQYHEDGKFEHKIDAEYSFPENHAFYSRRGNEVHLLESSFDLETQEGAQAFYDMLIYKSAPNMNCITEEFIQKHRYRKPEKIEFLHSMLSSELGLFEIVGTDFSEGYVYLKNVFTGGDCKIVDTGLSGSQNNDFYIYTRIITYQGLSFSSGLNLIFEKSDSVIKSHIQRHQKNFNPNGEFIRFTQLYNHFCKQLGKIKIVTNPLK